MGMWVSAESRPETKVRDLEGGFGVQKREVSGSSNSGIGEEDCDGIG